MPNPLLSPFNRAMTALIVIAALMPPLMCPGQTAAEPGRAAAVGPATPGTPAQVSIADFGAVGDGKTLNTKSIQAAIDHAAAAGGGVVMIPEGEFLSGAIFLKPGVSLYLADKAVLKGSSDVRDYPTMDTRIEGHLQPWLPALVNGDKVDHLRITGSGTLDGHGEPFWDAFWKRRKENPQCTNLEVERPRLIFIQDSHDVVISGITLKDSGFWNLHLYRCEQVVLEKLNIHAGTGSGKRAPSSDGIDLDSSQHIVVRDCTIAVDDDCIALKGTKGPFALDDKNSPPIDDIRVSGCTFHRGNAGITCGSEATIVRNVLLETSAVTGDLPALRLKLRPDTPQTYEDIHLKNLTIQGAGSILIINPWTQFYDLKGQPPPKSVVRNLTISGVKGAFASLGSIKGHKESVISDITMEDIDVTVKNTDFPHGQIENLSFKNVKVNGAPFPHGS